MRVKERRLRVRGGMERVYRLGLRRLLGLDKGSRVSNVGTGGSRGSVELLHLISPSPILLISGLPVN